MPVFFVILFHLAQDLIPALGVQAGGGLVQHEDAGLHGHDARHGHPALLAAGQLKGAAFQKGLVQADKGGCFVHPLVDLGFVQAHVLGAKGDVFIAGLLKQLVLRVLEHQTGEETEIPDFFRARPTGRGHQYKFCRWWACSGRSCG